MTSRLSKTALALAVSATAAFGAAALPGTALAGDRACQKWGNSAPDELSNGEARKAIFCLVNEKRDSAGLKPFDRSKKLQKAAQRHTNRMVGTGCFAHQCRGEAGLDSRLSSVDYLVNGLTSWAYGENIAWGMYDRGTPRAIVGAWMNSSGHRANILSRSFREIGVGFGAGTPQSKKDPGGIYTTDFGLAVG
jgi:uncharacterized protein YkwD